MTKQIALPYYSAEMQDLSALSLVGDSKSSDPNMFLDIGCGRPKYCNNTMLLEENGWEGICVDIEDFSEEFKEKRKTPFYQLDTTSDEFIEKLKESFLRKFIQYISLDVDVASLATLENLLKNGFQFAFMTFEHDYHWALTYARRVAYDKATEWGCEGRTREQVENCKFKSKSLLEQKGCSLLFENVSFHEKTTGDVLHPWEDWWINPSCFNYYHLLFLESLTSKNIHFKECYKRIRLSRGE